MKKQRELCYMETDSFIVYIKTKYIGVAIAQDYVSRFHSSNYEWDRPLPMRKNKTKSALMKHDLSEKVLVFVALIPKPYNNFDR